MWPDPGLIEKFREYHRKRCVVHLSIPEYPGVALCLCDPDEMRARGDILVDVNEITLDPVCPECREIWREHASHLENPD